MTKTMKIPKQATNEYKKVTIIPQGSSGIVTVVIAYERFVITVVHGDMSLDGDVMGTVVIVDEFRAQTGYDDECLSVVLRNSFCWDDDDIQDLQNTILTAVKSCE